MSNPFKYSPLTPVPTPDDSPGQTPTRQRLATIAESTFGYRQTYTPPPTPRHRSLPNTPLRQRPEPLIGEGGYTRSIDEDLDKLAELGFIIDVDYGHIGSGHYGDVYRGTYGQNVKQNYYCFDSKLIDLFLFERLSDS